MLLLFKNMVRSGPNESHTICKCLSSFFEPLNDQLTKSYLLAKTNLEESVQLLFNYYSFIEYTKNKCSFADAFELFIGISLFLHDMFYCTNWGDKKLFSYEHSLQYTIKDADGKLDCMLLKDLLQIFFPILLQIPFAEYKLNISATVFVLRAFSLKGTFTISMDNIILHIKQIWYLQIFYKSQFWHFCNCLHVTCIFTKNNLHNFDGKHHSRYQADMIPSNIL